MHTNDKKNNINTKNPFDNRRSATFTNEMLKNISEEIFINQKKKIHQMKYLTEKSSTRKIEEVKIDEKLESRVDTDKEKNENTIVSFNQKYKWDQATFDCDFIDGEEIPLIISEWSALNKQGSPKSSLELRSTIIKSGKKFNFQTCGLELNAVVTLKGESSIWIYSRAPETSINKNPIHVFNRHTSVIKISKEDKCQKCFISFGIFVEHENENGKENGSENGSNRNYQFKTFSKRQLVNFSMEKTKNRYYYENDICEIKVYLVDTAEENITVKIVINESKEENSISGSFFLPLEARSCVMLAGTGQSCLLKSLICKPFMKSFPFSVSNERKNCDCCSIY